MDYGEVLRRALAISWRHRFLWLLALLAGEGSTGSIDFRTPLNYTFGPAPGSRGTGATAASPSVQPALSWVTAHLAPLLAGAVAATLVIVVLFALSVVAEGAVVRAVAWLDAGAEATLGASWSAGAAVFWPMLRLRLLAFLAGLLALATVVAVLGLALLAGFALHSISLLLLLGWQWLGLLAVLFPLAIAAPTVLRLASRAVALEGAGAWASVVSALALARRRLGPVAALWAIQLAATFGLAIVFAVAGVGLLLPVFAGALGGMLAGSPAVVAPVAAYAVLAAAVLLVAGAAVSAFFSSYWTVGYRRLIRPAPAGR